jgi:hypothetical protein
MRSIRALGVMALGFVFLPLSAWAGVCATFVQDHYRWRNDDGMPDAWETAHGLNPNR